MRTISITTLAATAALIFLSGGVAQAKQGVWDQIPLGGTISTVLPDGTERTLEPSCSGGPQLVGDTIVPASTDFFFYVQKGNPNRLLISVDGGGACWDAATCIGSPLSGSSTYTVALDQTPGRLDSAEGIYDSGNPDNPFRNYTKIYIPYCTGDIHWGSKDTTYNLPGVGDWTIRHRGTDNFLAVLDWLQQNGRQEYGINFARAKDVTVTGPSAGGYGAHLAFAYVAELTKENARLNLISDSAIGVINESFYTAAIFNPDAPGSESWGVEQNLPSWVPGLDESLLAQGAAHPLGFVPSLFAALSDYQPKAKLATLTSNLDGIQLFFYGIMEGVVPPDQAIATQWYFSMADMTAATASLPNYRYYIDAGTFHTFIGDNQRVYEEGATGTTVADWLTEMIKPGNRNWDTLDAGAPF